MNGFLYDDGPRHERVKKRLLYSCFPVIFTEILRANFLQNISGLCIPHNIYPVNMYLFKVNNSNTRKRCDTYLKITIKARERCHRSLSGIFFCWLWNYYTPFFNASVVDFEQTNVYFEVFSCQERALKNHSEK